MRIVRIVASLGLILAILMSQRAEFRPGAANAATPQLKRISVSGSVTGGRYMTVKVTITAPAPGGLVVNLKSNRPSIVPVPPQMTFHTLATTQEISVRTKAINQAVDVTITATSGSVKLSDVVTVKPPQLSRLSIPGELQAGQQIKLSVYLNALAPLGGMVVTLSSNNPSILTVQSSVRVLSDTNRADIRFSINGFGTVTITATMNGVTVQATTTVVARPTATPTRTATATPTATATIFIGTVESSPTASVEPTGQETPTDTPTYVIGTIEPSITASVEPTGQTTPDDTATVISGTVETSVTATGQPTSTNTPVPPTATPTASGPTTTPTNVPGIVLQDIIVDGLNTSGGYSPRQDGH